MTCIRHTQGNFAVTFAVSSSAAFYFCDSEKMKTLATALYPLNLHGTNELIDYLFLPFSISLLLPTVHVPWVIYMARPRASYSIAIYFCDLEKHDLGLTSNLT